MSRAPYAPFDPNRLSPLGSDGWGAPPRAAAWTGAASPFQAPPHAGFVGPVPAGPPHAGFVGPVPAGPPPNVNVGFTAPTIIYDKMRTIDASATDLDVKVHTYVADPAFVRAWEAWLARWIPFYQKYQSDWSRLGAAFYSDDLNRQTEEFRSQLLSFIDQYRLQKQANGQPVPQPSAPPPLPANDPSPAQSTFGLPWWVWFLGGVAAVGGAYWLYKRYETAQAQKKVLEQEVLPGLIGPGLARAASAHDPSPPPPHVPMLERPRIPFASTDPYGVMHRDRMYERSLERSRDPYARDLDDEDDWEDD